MRLEEEMPSGEATDNFGSSSAQCFLTCVGSN